VKHEQNAFYLLSVEGDPWAIATERMRAYLNTFIVSDISAEEIEARTGPGPARFCDCEGISLTPHGATLSNCGTALEAAISSRRTKKAIAVLPLLGPITQRPGLFSAFFGGTSTEKWGQTFDDLVASQNVGAIVIDMDSPGGTVSGVPELAEKIFKARGTKPIVVAANGYAASAGYWIASSADEIVVTPSGEVGSIGVWSMHIDMSAALEKLGENVTLISAGKFKTEWNPYEPLGEEAKAYEQANVDRYYGQFVDAVARGRGTTANTVRKGFGQGRMVGPKEAVSQGMADRIATLEQTIKRLGGRIAEREQARAEHEAREKWLAEQEKELPGDDNDQPTT
jgi:signal peptide peptidase SppA